MAEPYQMYILIPDGVPAERAVRAVDRAFYDEGGELGEDSMMLLNDRDDDEDRDFEPIGDREVALGRLIAWPTLGMFVYDMPDGDVLASFKGGEGVVRCVVIATPETLNDLDPDTIERYRRIGRRLQTELSATRTVMDWGLSAQGRDWSSELARAARGDDSHTFKIVDIRD